MTRVMAAVLPDEMARCKWSRVTIACMWDTLEGVHTDRLACGLSLVIGVNGISVQFNIGLASDLVQKR